MPRSTGRDKSEGGGLPVGVKQIRGGKRGGLSGGGDNGRIPASEKGGLAEKGKASRGDQVNHKHR